MSAQNQEEAIGSYTGLMDEAKHRIYSLNQVLSGLTPLGQTVGQEFCYLQLRFLCEIIALACLVAHGDIVVKKGIHKEYSADKIVEHLASLHPDFYPQPVSIEMREGHMRAQGGVIKGYLDRRELPTLYGKCGGFLHRGSLKGFLSRRSRRVDFPEVLKWAQKIENLLATHVTSLVSGTAILCILREGSAEGPTRSFILQRRPDLDAEPAPQIAPRGAA